MLLRLNFIHQLLFLRLYLTKIANLGVSLNFAKWGGWGGEHGTRLHAAFSGNTHVNIYCCHVWLSCAT